MLQDIFEVLVDRGLENWRLILFSCVCCQAVQWIAHLFFLNFVPFYRKISAEKQLDCCVRSVSMAHAMVAMCVIPGWIYPDPELAVQDANGNWRYNHFGFSAESQYFFSISIGYFLWDFIICIYYRWYVATYFSIMILGVLNLLYMLPFAV